MGDLQNLLTQDFLQKLNMFNLKIPNTVSNSIQGNKKSNSKGNSLEFADYKNYILGDDVKKIDWNIYSRHEKLYVKLFNEEKQATINIFLDKSNSMDFGDCNKFLYAKQLVASIAYLALKNSDKVNIFCLDEQISFEKTNLRSKSSFAEVVSFLDNIKPSNKTNFELALKQSLNKKINQGLSIIISDFLFDVNLVSCLKMLKMKKQSISLVQILDEKENTPDSSGALKFYDSETNEFLEVLVTDEALNNYNLSLENLKNDLRKYTDLIGAKYIFSLTCESIFNPIQKILN